MQNTKPRKRLNAKQIDILVLLYKFRFATRELIVQYQGLESRTYTHYRLHGLLEQNYIGRDFKAEDKINRRAATYHILLKGIRLLRLQGLNSVAINLMYNDYRLRRRFVDHCLNIFKLYLKFSNLYGRSLEFYTKSELSDYDHFPKPLPDAFITYKNQIFILELIEDNLANIAVRKKLQRYFQYYYDGDWSSISSTFPPVLLICESGLIERRAQRISLGLLNKAEIEAVGFYTTSFEAIIDAQNKATPIWRSSEDKDTLLNLDQVFANSSA